MATRRSGSVEAEQIAAALATFHAEASDLLNQVEDLLEVLAGAPGDREALNALFRCAHTIKGSAGLFGLDRVVGSPTTSSRCWTSCAPAVANSKQTCPACCCAPSTTRACCSRKAAASATPARRTTCWSPRCARASAPRRAVSRQSVGRGGRAAVECGLRRSLASVGALWRAGVSQRIGFAGHPALPARRRRRAVLRAARARRRHAREPGSGVLRAGRGTADRRCRRAAAGRRGVRIRQRLLRDPPVAAGTASGGPRLPATRSCRRRGACRADHRGQHCPPAASARTTGGRARRHRHRGRPAPGGPRGGVPDHQGPGRPSRPAHQPRRRNGHHGVHRRRAGPRVRIGPPAGDQPATRATGGGSARQRAAAAHGADRRDLQPLPARGARRQPPNSARTSSS